MERKIYKVKKSEPRYVVFEIGAMNPKKITKLSLSEAKKAAEKMLSKKQRLGRRVVIRKITEIYSEKSSLNK